MDGSSLNSPDFTRDHWSRAQAAVLNRFNWPSKSKVDIAFVVKLASEVADLATAEYLKRVEELP
jgi:hypothetical protein